MEFHDASAKKVEECNGSFFVIGYDDEGAYGAYGPFTFEDAKEFILDTVAPIKPVKWSIAANVGDYFVYPEN